MPADAGKGHDDQISIVLVGCYHVAILKRLK